MEDDLRDRLALLTLWDERRLTRRLEAAERGRGGAGKGKCPGGPAPPPALWGRGPPAPAGSRPRSAGGTSPSWPPSSQIWYGRSSASSAAALPCLLSPTRRRCRSARPATRSW